MGQVIGFLLPHKATEIEGCTFRFLLNYKNPKSLKVGLGIGDLSLLVFRPLQDLRVQSKHTMTPNSSEPYDRIPENLSRSFALPKRSSPK